MPFDFNAKYALLTYAQCNDLRSEHVANHFESLEAGLVVGVEHHADGGRHLHAFISFGRKFHSRDARVFDVGGYHPNIVPSKGNPKGGYDYATKDGCVEHDTLNWGTVSKRQQSKTAELWTEITSADTRDEFFGRALKLDPKSLCCSFGNLAKYADWRYPAVLPAYVGWEQNSFSVPIFSGIEEWILGNVHTEWDGITR